MYSTAPRGPKLLKIRISHENGLFSVRIDGTIPIFIFSQHPNICVLTHILRLLNISESIFVTGWWCDWLILLTGYLTGLLNVTVFIQCTTRSNRQYLCSVLGLIQIASSTDDSMSSEQEAKARDQACLEWQTKFYWVTQFIATDFGALLQVRRKMRSYGDGQSGSKSLFYWINVDRGSSRWSFPVRWLLVVH